MYCTHCGKDVKVDTVGPNFERITMPDGEADEKTKYEFVCPRCGHLFHSDINQDEVKSLSRAAHAEIQRGRNSFASGMGFVIVGLIVLVIAIIFFRLSHKAANQFALSTTCVEFYVSLVLFILGGTSFISGSVFVGIGVHKNVKYGHLLRDINNETFIQ